MNYELNFDHISILDSSLIDSESYRNENFYSLLECQSILKNIHFYLEKDGVIVFDSKIHNALDLDYNLCVEICGRISEKLHLKQKEIELFEKQLKNPNIILPEKIIANLIKSSMMQLSLQDIKSMTPLEYEKLQIAMSE